MKSLFLAAGLLFVSNLAFAHDGRGFFHRFADWATSPFSEHPQTPSDDWESHLKTKEAANTCLADIYPDAQDKTKPVIADARRACLYNAGYTSISSKEKSACVLALRACMRSVIRRAGLDNAIENLKHYEDECAELIHLEYGYSTNETCENNLEWVLGRQLF